MKKEISIAVLIGLLLGLIITYGVYRTQLLFTSESQEVEQVIGSPNPEPTEQLLSLTQPENGTVQTNGDISIVGNAKMGSFVVLFADNEDYIITPEEDGSFHFSTSLEEGTTIIRVHAINSEGQTTMVERVVVIEEPEPSPSAEASPSATPSTTQENT
ncbi:MAG: hypothetical protein H6774_02895 [Pseudomonadales bacterium]|nr:hypothetical protein [Candidatus Woesebacteria bacterium]MCB9802013.1 hypothetical protein [Pseudomonadales bacterium]